MVGSFFWWLVSTANLTDTTELRSRLDDYQSKFTLTPAVAELLHSIKLAEFWYGFTVASVILVTCGLWYLSVVDSRHSQNLKLIENENNEYMQVYKQRIFTLKDEINQLTEESQKSKNNIVQLLESSNQYCKKQMQLINVLQKDHKLETNISVNYEYLSILEKVLIKMFNNAESCEQVTRLQ